MASSYAHKVISTDKDHDGPKLDVYGLLTSYNPLLVFVVMVQGFMIHVNEIFFQCLICFMCETLPET
jgi:hypothetical protein